MSTPNVADPTTRLTRRDKQAMRRDVLAWAQRTGHRAYQYGEDRDQRLQVTGLPNGRALIGKVDQRGLTTDAPMILTALGVPARYLGIATAALALVAEIVHVALG